MSSREVKISKALSYLLRHGAVKEKLPIDSRGFIELKTILNHPRIKTHKATEEEIEQVVVNNDKKRFSIETRKDGKKYICANQGHSLNLVTEENLIQLAWEEMPKKVYHGTFTDKYEAIKSSGGLSKMSRNHIHFTSDAEWSKSGIRKTCNVLIYLDLDKCKEQGLTFFRSANGVILTKGNAKGMIPLECFQEVQTLKKQGAQQS
ncbi:hypothetical protein FT663_03132 [Candidozyma haemuli var. vulneris]|uniref:2'-phosphotransferase n=1 Tax=Candidozyma haemuli TaxID=45357 RepID=A0A2V1B0H1_9ASCO|nr:hypothetical protein CXQ85_005195 [[Candida] haemuloni]KAF3985238.1 hypothetical protein FT662_05277 [[Candida] haemuloni var. vulneris]KAF3990573.1 hypothetical protein FT663_03132 [[Candida] haemuloni var. vulneris]PVH22621.1 hypothetical protein CXQ85_005195 [[Candida] haemuloni]